MGWTWKDDAFEDIEEDDLDAEMDRREVKVKLIARRLSELRESREQASYIRQVNLEDNGHDDPEFESEAEALHWAAQRDIEAQLEAAEIAKLEAMLDELGARMKRPYEAWNEDEKLMAYLERDRD